MKDEKEAERQVHTDHVERAGYLDRPPAADDPFVETHTIHKEEPGGQGGEGALRETGGKDAQETG